MIYLILQAIKSFIRTVDIHYIWKSCSTVSKNKTQTVRLNWSFKNIN